MQGWKIVVHSIRMVFGNIGAALRVSLLLYLIQMATSLYAGGRIGHQMMALGQMGQIPEGALGYSLLLLVVTVLTSLWIAVAWHRYVLLEEEPGAFLPPFRMPEILQYLWLSLLIGIIMIVAGIVLGIVAGALVATLAGGFGEGGPSKGSMIMIMLIVYFPLIYLFYRLSPALPAAALGKKMGLGEAWSVTAPASGAIFQVSILGVGAMIVLSVPQSYMNPGSLVSLVYTGVVNWVYMMVGISVLTTIYGIYVEGREI